MEFYLKNNKKKPTQNPKLLQVGKTNCFEIVWVRPGWTQFGVTKVQGGGKPPKFIRSLVYQCSWIFSVSMVWILSHRVVQYCNDYVNYCRMLLLHSSAKALFALSLFLTFPSIPHYVKQGQKDTNKADFLHFTLFHWKSLTAEVQPRRQE